MGTVLIVEDDNFVGGRLASAMRGAGWSVLMAASLDQAVTMGRLFAVDLVIADVAIQDSVGIDAARRVTAIRPSVDVLYVSPHSRRRVEQRLPVGGAFLQMPFDERSLWDAVATLRPAVAALAATA